MRKICVPLFLAFALFLFLPFSSGTAGAQTAPSKPVVEIGNAPSKGRGDAPVTLIEFSDFECPFCKRFNDRTLARVLEKYGDKVRFAYKHFPLSEVHPQAANAAKASSCVYFMGEESAFFKYYDVLFDRVDEWKKDETRLVTYAKDLGLDETKLSACMKSPATERWVTNDLEEGKKLGVEKVPTCFVNGRKVTGAQPFELFVKIIDEELNQK